MASGRGDVTKTETYLCQPNVLLLLPPAVVGARLSERPIWTDWPLRIGFSMGGSPAAPPVLMLSQELMHHKYIR